MPFTAALSDIFGRPVCLLASLALFTVGSVLCAFSHNLATLLTGRCIQGVGGGGIIILGLVIFTDIVPLRFRPKYYGIMYVFHHTELVSSHPSNFDSQGAWALGTCIGPVIGGVFVEHTTWRWVFYLMFPFCFVGFASIPWLLTLKPKTSTLREKLLRVDWMGGFLFISSSTAFLIAISWGGTQEPWGSFRTIVPLVLGVIGMAAALLWERCYAREPFLRRSLFHCRSSFAAYIGAAVQGLLVSEQSPFLCVDDH